VLTGALSVGMIGGVGTYALAATPDTNEVKQTVQALDAATQEKVQKIKEELKTQLAELGVTLPERANKGDRFANLDEETKAKAEAIMEQKKAGTITQEEAKTQLEALGVTLPERANKGDRFANLDEETKAKAEAIVEQKKAGTITQEEAKTQLEALGVTAPKHGHKGNKQDILANLDEETKAKAQELLDNAKSELEELGVNHNRF
jgi:hypothetical protein